jgi:hypothetical protein
MKKQAITFFVFGILLNSFAQSNFDTNSFFLDSASTSVQKQSYQLVENFSNNPAFTQTNDQLLLGTKSKGKAFLFSLVVPGMGERYVGASKKATFFLATEITLWLTYSGFITYREWRREDYKTFAGSFAQVDLDGKSESYFIDVGNYNSIYDYNEAKLRDRNLPDYYRDVDTFFWQWQNESKRQKFDQLRIASDTANNRSMFVVGAILANHLVSAIDAVWSAHKANQVSQSKINLDVQFGDGYIQPTVNIGLTARF